MKRLCIYEFCPCNSRTLPKIGHKRVNGIGIDFDERNLHKRCFKLVLSTRDGLKLLIRYNKRKKHKYEAELRELCDKYTLPYEDLTYEEELMLLNAR